jgi:hypothetical protein
MAFQLEQIVPWGRSFDEYVRMFSLTANETRILGCGDGPASFNATMHRMGNSMVSVDPLYRFSTEEIRVRIQEVYPTIMEQLLANQLAYVWTTVRSPHDLGRLRMEAMEEFLGDFDLGKSEGRYLSHELPELPFEDVQFDLALCSHLLFTYSQQLSCEFHCRAILEMCRVAKEVRVFPLLDLGGQRTPHFDPVCRFLRENGEYFEVQPMEYEFQRGSNKMLRIRFA